MHHECRIIEFMHRECIIWESVQAEGQMYLNSIYVYAE